jgi:glycine cleavage system H lipoate-binding protein
MSRKGDVVQVRNPKSGHYVKIDRSAGKIVSHKKSSVPYKGVPVGRKKTK